jgi:pyruvate dehydrogenase E2 component (dihydrolipoamide acetyltransferase)
MIEFKLPELGENITAGDVLRVMVSPGDKVEKDQPVVELETDKATIEVPSSVAGVVKEIRVKAGDKVKVGQAILVLEEGAGEDKKQDKKEDKKEEAPRQDAPKQETPRQEAPRGSAPQQAADKPARIPEEGALDQNVGGGGKVDDRARPGEERIDAQTEAETKEPEAPRSRRGEVVDIRGPRAAPEPEPPAETGPLAPAAPSVRRMARELGVDIHEVSGSGPGDRISVEDVKAHAKKVIAGVSIGGHASPAALPDFTKWGDV